MSQHSINPVLAHPAVTTQVCHDISQDIRVQLDILTYNVVTHTYYVMTSVKTFVTS